MRLVKGMNFSHRIEAINGVIFEKAKSTAAHVEAYCRRLST
jgi:hypothetical protein